MCTCAIQSCWALLADGAVTFDDAAAPGALERGCPPRGRAVFEGVTVVNPLADRTSGARLVIDDGRITEIERSDEGTAPTGFVLPGFIDMHVHTPPVFDRLYGLLHLMHGVTSVRDMGGPPSLFELRASIRAGRRPGPRMFLCGPPIDGSPRTFPMFGTAVRAPEEARAEVRKLAQLGANHIKAFISLTPPLLDAIQDEAKRYELPVTGHVPRHCDAESVRLADVQHLTGLPDHAPTAFALDGSFAGWLRAWKQLDADRVTRLADAGNEDGTAQTPTLAMWKGLARNAGGDMDTPPTDGLLPEWFCRAFWADRRPAAPFVRGLTPEVLAELPSAYPRMIEAVAALSENDTELLVGTDSINPWVVPGASFHDELRTLTEVGLSPEQVIANATRRAGDRVGLSRLGRLEVGAPADLCVYRKDPTLSLDNLSTLETVVADGRAYDAEDLSARHAREMARLSRPVARFLGTAAARAVSRLWAM